MPTNVPDDPLDPAPSGDPIPPKKRKPIKYALNWDRSIHINEKLDDALVKHLTPEILRLKQRSSAPITVAIDSFGGSIASLESLIGLLKAPDQDGNRCE
jgi:ATP-dependent protease ClpP protease subunit